MSMGKASVHRGQIVGMRLKAARQKQGLSQQEVAKRSGVSDRTVLNWETGRAIPKPERLSALGLTRSVNDSASCERR